MKTYQYHSAKFGSEVQVSYNRHGILSGFEVIDSSLIERLPIQDKNFGNFFYEADFLASARQANLKVKAVDVVIPFDLFWDAYKQKDCGRTKCEALWNTLSRVDQVEAYKFIPAFNGIIANGKTPKPYATTYLNSKRWIR